ncbi:MAG: BON domain-containing protein [Pseudohongiellaceae bacterium]|uniref:Phospholipid-binding protein n=1 Tax=OM182 bacterium MED-G28 TaxID=1986256 RepID=A0A2A5W9U0_9GAMM|nr:phospholipid-binding protein [Gammaproteobacteria bacterium]MAX07843.1 phospholipid-binding protein [Gammaproteobacteria bacterium]PDH33058.1 MAG: phospholipid-binding protein [OM182 bacterium MED-G28]
MKIYRVFAFLILVTLASCSTILVNTTNRDGMQEDPTERTTGAIIEDRSIETKIAVNMQAIEPAFRKSSFDVISHNGVVLLIGQVESSELKSKATEIASKASTKIKRIHNEIEVSGRTGILSRGNDTWIATKVRTLMLANAEVPSGQVRVVVENGAVYLMGIISQSEGDNAANIARNVAGVTKVVKVFEYLS